MIIAKQFQAPSHIKNWRNTKKEVFLIGAGSLVRSLEHSHFTATFTCHLSIVDKLQLAQFDRNNNKNVVRCLIIIKS